MNELTTGGENLGDAPETYVLPRPFVDDGGHSVRVPLPRELAERHGDLRWDDPSIVVLEDGVPLPLPTDQHGDIRRVGRGRYSAWGSTLYLSSTDGTSCQDNGREYTISLRQPDAAAVAGATMRANPLLHRPRIDIMARPSIDGAADCGGVTLYSLQPEPLEGGAPFGGPRDPSEIPGMVVADEQALLATYAGTVDLSDPDRSIIELGPFLGRSTAALVFGAAHNPSLDLASRREPVITTVDQFRWTRSPAAEEMLGRFTREGGVGHLVTETDEGMLSFAPVFEHFMSSVDPRVVAHRRAHIHALPEIPGRIVFMHLDAPKNDVGLLSVMRAFGDQLEPGAPIAFQDFFFHGSSRLIAAIGWLMREGLLLPEDAAWSTLVCRAPDPLGAAAAAALEAGLAAEDAIALIDVATAAVEAVCAANEPDRFMARLLLARTQLAVEAGELELAADTLRSIHRRYGASPDLLDDVADLVRSGFRSDWGGLVA